MRRQPRWWAAARRRVEVVRPCQQRGRLDEVATASALSPRPSTTPPPPPKPPRFCTAEGGRVRPGCHTRCAARGGTFPVSPRAPGDAPPRAEDIQVPTRRRSACTSRRGARRTRGVALVAARVARRMRSLRCDREVLPDIELRDDMTRETPRQALTLHVAPPPPRRRSIVGGAPSTVRRHSAAADASLLLVSRADVVWPRDFGCLRRRRCARAALAPSCGVELAECVAAVPRAKRAPTPVTNWTEAYAECRARQKSATACVPLLDLCRKYQRVHHALLVAPPLRLDPRDEHAAHARRRPLGRRRARRRRSPRSPAASSTRAESSPLSAFAAQTSRRSLAWSGTVWERAAQRTGPARVHDASLAGSGTCATTAAEQGPGSGDTAAAAAACRTSLRTTAAARARPPRGGTAARRRPQKHAPAGSTRRTRVPTVLVGGQLPTNT